MASGLRDRPGSGDGKGRYPENATVIERLHWYRDNGLIAEGRALARTADYLEECFLWEIQFHQ
jgi:hypothetical protein